MSRKEGLDLLLINPGGREKIYQSLGSELAAIEPPVWVGLMATYVRRHGFSVRVLDANAENLSPQEAADLSCEMNPLLVGVVVYGHQPSASTQTMPGASAICTALKQKAPDQKTLLVGGHVAALPERTLREEAVDFVVGGEGLVTLLELLSAMTSSGPTDFSKVRGLYFREGANIAVTAPAPLVKDLDGEIPEVAWDLLPMDKYRAHNWHCFGTLQRQPYASIYTTLGCPYHCSFCCIQAPFKTGEKVIGMKESVNSYRFWSPDVVVAQIDKLVTEYGVRNIKFADEMFVLNPKHVLGICDRLIERDYGLNIWAYARVDTIADGMLEKLKRAGFHWIVLGIEAANERVRKDVQKGFGQEKVYETVRACKEAGVNVIGNYIFGLPEDDLETMQQTLDLALELNCEFANLYSAMAYPGSQLYQQALKERLPLPESWSGYSQHSVDTLPLPTRHLSAAQVLRFRDEAFHVYFNSPSYLKMIDRKFGPATREHIQGMASTRLVRKIVPESKPVAAGTR